MGLPYFVFKGIDSRDMGLAVITYPPITRPIERVTQKSLPGRPGSLTLTEGDDIFEGYIRTISFANIKPNRMQDVMAWLRGSGELIVGNEPDRVYYARVINAIDGSKLWKGTQRMNAQFWCQPYKGLFPPESDITLTATGTVVNPGDVASRPILTIFGANAAVLTVNGTQMDINGFSAGFRFTVDCDAGTAVNSQGLNMMYRISGGMPTLSPGSNTITFGANITQVIITPRWRWIG